LEPQTYSLVVNKWLGIRNDNATGIASQKALELALRCPTFDVEILSIIVQLLIDRQQAADSRHKDHQTLHPWALNLASLIEQNLDSIPADQTSLLMASAFRLLTTHPKSGAFLEFLLDRNVPVTAEIADAAVQWVPTNVAPLIPRLLLREDNAHGISTDDEDRLQLGFNFYKVALWHAMDHPSEFQIMDSVLPILYEAIASLQKQGQTPTVRQGEDLAGMAESVFRLLVNATPRDGATLEEMLLKTEQVLSRVIGRSESVDGSSPSPVLLDFYASVVTELSEHDLIAPVERIVDRLRELHRSGHDEQLLYPSHEIYAVYFKMLRDAAKMESLDKRIELWLELIGVYEASDMKPERYRPGYQNFDSLVCDLYDRAQLADKTAIDDPIEKDSRTAVLLLEKLHQLRIQPKNLSRVYPFNQTMDLILGCRNEYMHFKVVMTLKRQMDELRIEPNFFTMQKILRACERAPKSKQKHLILQSFTVMLEMLIEIRRLGRANSGIYSQCFRVFLSSHATLTPNERVNADKMLATIFQCCVDDGCLAKVVRDCFRTLASQETFHRLYVERLLNGTEPKEWTRNHGKVF
jgi:hypothetical protein